MILEALTTWFVLNLLMNGRPHFAINMANLSVQLCLLPHKCASWIFQYMTNDFFQDFMDIFLMIYLNDILVYSKTQDKHDVHVRKVLYTFVGFYAKLERCCLDDNQREF